MRARRPAAPAVVDRLRALAELRHRDPQDVVREVEVVLGGLAEDDPARATGSWALGLAHHELAHPAAAIAHLRDAVARASREGDRHTEALARSSLAISLLSTGDVDAAASELATAADVAPRSAADQVGMLRGLLQQRTGRLDEALATYTEVLPRMRRSGDEANVARLLLNRGILRAYQGDIGEALRDLRESEAGARDLGLVVLEAMAAHNVGFAEGRRGDIPAALAAFDRAEAAYRAQGDPPRLVAALASDRCEVYLAAGLDHDAVGAARLAVTRLDDLGEAVHAMEARLLLARSLLAAGDLDAARAEAQHVATDLRRARRTPWAAQAEYLALQAEILAIQDRDRPPGARTLARAQRIARLLEDAGWPVEALHARTFVARVALALDRPEVARETLSALVGARARGTAPLRVQTWHATALLRLADGDRRGARRALRRGMAVVDQHRASLGATELRAAATARGADLARLGLRMAVADGRAWDVLQWAERWRAGSLRLAPVTPPDDPLLDRALQELRDRQASHREAVLGGQSDLASEARIAALERIVRARTLRATDRREDLTAELDPGGLRSALGDAMLVELIDLEGRVLAITVAGGRARLHDLAATVDVTTEQGYLRAAHRRALSASPGTDAAHRALDAMDTAARRLDEMLLGPLRLRGRSVVVVPTGSLHGLGWSSLPSLRGRPVTVAPSADLWQRRARRRRRVRGDRVALVVGPDLPGGAREVRALGRVYPDARVLRGRSASVRRVQDAMEGADLVHLAAHGSFRADSPLFSALRLADGLLTVYDLERLRAAPDTVVLPACDAALASVQAGDELLGTAAAMLGLGVASVVAPVLPVPDDATARVMVRLHERLRKGVDAATALGDAGEESTDPHDRAVAAAFLAIGAGAR